MSVLDLMTWHLGVFQCTKWNIQFMFLLMSSTRWINVNNCLVIIAFYKRDRRKKKKDILKIDKLQNSWYVHAAFGLNCSTVHVRDRMNVLLTFLFFVLGEVPCVWSERYLSGCGRFWHPCLHLQAVVWSPQLHWWGGKCFVFFSYK